MGGILARSQEKFSILIYAYIFTGNHYHLLVRAPYGHLDEFAENVNREISRRVNWRVKRRGKFWEKRYSDQVVLSSDDAMEAFVYIVTNPTKHGLVAHPNSYPGLGCYHQILDGTDRTFEFTHHSRRVEGKKVKTSHCLVLSSLPQFENLGWKERRKIFLRRINERADYLKVEREKSGVPFGSASSLRRQKPGSIPKAVARSPRPLAYSKDPVLIREHRKNACVLRTRYDEASARYRAGERDVKFPEFTLMPPAHRLPRISAFGHLTRTAA